MAKGSIEEFIFALEDKIKQEKVNTRVSDDSGSKIKPRVQIELSNVVNLHYFHDIRVLLCVYDDRCKIHGYDKKTKKYNYWYSYWFESDTFDYRVSLSDPPRSAPVQPVYNLKPCIVRIDDDKFEYWLVNTRYFDRCVGHEVMLFNGETTFCDDRYVNVLCVTSNPFMLPPK